MEVTSASGRTAFKLPRRQGTMGLGPSLDLHFGSHCVHVYISYNSILNCMENDGKLNSSWIAGTHCCVEWHMNDISEVC